MAVVSQDDIADLFSDGPITGPRIVKGVKAVLEDRGQTHAVLSPIATVRYFSEAGKGRSEDISTASALTLEQSVAGRLPRYFPKDVQEVHLHAASTDPYAILVEKDRKYTLKK